MMRDDLSDHETLLRFAAGELSASEASAVERRLEVDAEARRVVALSKVIAATVRSDDAAPVSARALERAKALFRAPTNPEQHATSAATWLAAVDRFVAKLLFDSRGPAALSGYRGSVAESRRLSFATDDGAYEVDLEISPAPRDMDATTEGATAFRVLGQISGVPESDSRTPLAFVLAGSSTVVRESVTDDAGEFNVFLPAGAFDLAFRVGGRVVVLQGIVIE